MKDHDLQPTGAMKPILFSTEMVKAILDGRKSQTRRIVKFPDNFDGINVYNNYPFGLKYGDWDGTTKRLFPKHEAGDILWVRETHWVNHLAFARENPAVNLQLNDIVKYKADGFKLPLDEKWRPSIFMRQAAARIFLEVTDVMVERLQDISDENAKAEGIKSENGMYFDYDGDFGYSLTPYHSYQTLWASINGKGSWEKNPFVWVITFKRIEKPVTNKN